MTQRKSSALKHKSKKLTINFQPEQIFSIVICMFDIKNLYGSLIQLINNMYVDDFIFLESFPFLLLKSRRTALCNALTYSSS